MNYLRGAVNAISAPYQYYRDLPPINPSTLTGAIDIIVVQCPTNTGDTGDTEFVCSPFHVRFGKWKVLRPQDKMVNVFVNGQPTPFKMKIGEAGEAFFVFEIEGHVPDELITSPILQPTLPEEPVPKDEDGTLRPPEEDLAPLPVETNHIIQPSPQALAAAEPEFLDLDALPSPPADDFIEKAHPTPSNFFYTPLLTKPSRTSPGEASSFLPSPPSTPTNRSTITFPIQTEQDIHADEALRRRGHEREMHTPTVEFHNGLALDVEGYHSHDRERSTQKVSPSTNEHPTPESESGKAPSEASSSICVASEPPHLPEHHLERKRSKGGRQRPQLTQISSVQEYSWEWGAFPQPSPVKTKFGKIGRVDGTRSRVKGKGKEKSYGDLESIDDHTVEVSADVIGAELEQGRSRSVPPELDGSPSGDREEKPLPAESLDGQNKNLPAAAVDVMEEEARVRAEIFAFGTGGKLGPSKMDLTRFVLQVDEKKVTFELSVAPKGERDAVFQGLSAFDGDDEDQAARMFGEGKVDFDAFLDDENIIKSSDLVIRWAESRHVARVAGSPLMAALVSWREAALLEREKRIPDRPTSPLSEDESVAPSPLPDKANDGSLHRANTEPPGGRKRYTSLSWVQWWSSGRATRRMRGADLEEARSANGTEIPHAESAPAYPSTPVQDPVDVPIPVAKEVVTPQTRKFAKTLRLSSDQLKALNLKAGANTITFSLSASGAIACTARIFLWESTDFVVISDIDGTITKSDGLGHVFAMIGRDWTHVGVVKLYTDIARNGYKILYLTSRAIGQADATRGYLKGIKQSDYRLPEGPVIMSPDRLMASLHREVIMRKPEVFKMACLRDIQRLFGDASRNPFYAGFGNRITDALSYRSVDVPSARIFTIDSSGVVKMELLELAGYKSSYIHMTDLVDQMFPPIHRKWTPEYTDFNYWKAPLQDFPLPDLSPPSPTLSARSDASQGTLARLKNFSLVGSRQSSVRALSPPVVEEDRAESQLRQVSSFERLRDTLGFYTRRSTSPDSLSSGSYDSDDDEEGGEFDMNGGKRRERRRSMTSMPGTLDERQFDFDDDELFYEEGDEERGQYELDEDDGAEGGDEAFDEDLLAEMKDVPFL